MNSENVSNSPPNTPLEDAYTKPVLPDISGIKPEDLTPYEISLNLPLIALVIKHSRVARQFAPKDIYEITGIKPSTLSAIENSAKRPQRIALINLSAVLDIPEVNKLLILAGHQPIDPDDLHQ